MRWLQHRTVREAVMIALVLLALPGSSNAQTPTETLNPAAQLADKQRDVAEKYDRLEQLLLRMSALSAGTDPRRAALLKKAVAESKQRMIGVQFASLVDELAKDQLSDAIDGQEQLDIDLTALLKLLLSENRSKRIASEKARIRQYLKQLNSIINQQKGLQARTAGGSGQPRELSQQQGSIGEQTDQLAEDIRENEEQDPDESDTDKSEKGDLGDSKKGQPKEGQPKDPSEKPEGDPGKSGEQKDPAESGGKPGQQSKPKSSQQGGAQSGGQQPSKPEQSEEQQAEQAHPARQRLEAARNRMRQAQEKLDKAQREDAAEEQEEAIRELLRAKAELEEILRQLREEEIEQVLVALEARLMKMLQMQRDVHDGTERLDKVSADGLTHEQEIEAGRLGTRETEIIADADAALLLLREEGSAVAMPEALAQAREDMAQVATRLAKAKVGQITLGLEKDIVVALEEMLDAVRQAMEDAEQRRQQGKQGQRGTPQDPALVDMLAELRMIRALQMRVNTRTERYGLLISGRHAETQELLDALIQLADRQSRVYRITRDLESGKNQ